MPLPAPPEPMTGGSATFLKPTRSIKPPVAPPLTAGAQKSAEQLLGVEQRVISERLASLADRRERETKAAAALKRLVVLRGPVGKRDDPGLVLRALGEEKPVTLIGVNAPSDTLRRLEGFFGVTLTPDNEQKILDAVRSGFAGSTKQQRKVELLGWWPDEGVMAVAVWPES